MITWPRVRIIFFWIGLFSTAVYGYEALGVGLNAILDGLKWLEEAF